MSSSIYNIIARTCSSPSLQRGHSQSCTGSGAAITGGGTAKDASCCPPSAAFRASCLLRGVRGVRAVRQQLSNVQCVRTLLYVCPRTSGASCVCVRILLHVSAYCCMCPHADTYMCPRSSAASSFRASCCVVCERCVSHCVYVSAYYYI